MPEGIIGKTVHILGAGASAHAGVPLLNDFLARSRSLVSGKKDIKSQDSFTNVLKWVDSLRSPAYYLDLDLDNLEHIFSLVAMMREVGDPRADQLYREVSRLIFETIDNSCTVQSDSDGQYNPDPAYASFARVIIETNDQRRRPTPNLKDSVVTLNYDVLLDYVFWFAYGGCDYGVGRTDERKVKVLKLHGSMNWGRHLGCESPEGRETQVVPASPVAKGFVMYTRSGEKPKAQHIPFKMFTNTLHDTKCCGCQKPHQLEPVFIPPTWFKSCKTERIESVWKLAIEEFKTARQIVIVGYSLPPTDTFLPYLLMLGLADNADLYRVVVVNPNKKDDLRARYERMFSRSMGERGRLQFLPTTFENYVHKFMRNVTNGEPINFDKL